MQIANLRKKSVRITYYIDVTALVIIPSTLQKRSRSSSSTGGSGSGLLLARKASPRTLEEGQPHQHLVSSIVKVSMCAGLHAVVHTVRPWWRKG